MDRGSSILHRRGIGGGLVLLAALLLLGTGEARADHSLGKSCVYCHTLRSANVITGSRNIVKTRVETDQGDTFPLYDSSVGWYCSPSWPESNGAQPLDCSACHDQDIAKEIQSALGGKYNPGVGQGSAHPVGVQGDVFMYKYNDTPRILCNDCHNGDSGALLPATECSKSDTDGYPNHKGVRISLFTLPGSNDLVENPPHLSYLYSTGLWTTTNFNTNKSNILCFVCHDRNTTTKPPYTNNAASSGKLGFNENAMTDVLKEYTATGGGHNVPGVGAGVGGDDSKKVACYHCHDAHASSDTSTTRLYYNKALILTYSYGSDPHPFDADHKTADKTFNTFSANNYGYDMPGDRELCLGCHGAATVENNAVVGVLDLSLPGNSGNLMFGFHKNAHAEAKTTGNCLQKNGGCHPSPHYTAPYDCLSCHAYKSYYGADLVNGVTITNARLLRVANVASEFGSFNGVVGNGILSQHNIPRDPGTAASPTDMSLPANNGCLYCHSVPGTSPNAKVAVIGGSPVEVPTVPANREGLSVYNDFCVSCHDGNSSNGQLSFTFKIGSSSTTTTLYAPQVDRYFVKGGHGTGFSTDTFESNNKPYLPKVPCLECHVYHGSTMYKLLPGNTQTVDYAPRTGGALYDKGGRVIKKFAYAANGDEPLSVLYPLGNDDPTTKIDYRDYTIKETVTPARFADNSRRALKFANYDAPWSTYYEAADNASEPTRPSGVRIEFGTSGDVVNVPCGPTTPMTTYLNSPNLGFCDACHMYNDATDGTNKTVPCAFTHQGLPGDTFCDGNGTRSKVAFQKDCTECHDPHGSGDTTTSNPNWYMVRGKIVTGLVGDTYNDLSKDIWGVAKTYNVVLDEPQGQTDGIFVGPDSLDEKDSDNKDDICAVCHSSTNHNTRATVDPNDHMAGTNCVQCHGHAKAPIGFPQGSSCNACHGYPPRAAGTTGDVPPDENYTGGGSFHPTHVNFLLDVLNFNADVLNTFSNTLELCGPCHGEGAGITNHLNASPSGCQAPTPWDVGNCRPYVNVLDRNAPAYSWGTLATYGGYSLSTASQAMVGPQTRNNSRCVDLNCHGRPLDTDPGYVAWADYALITGETADSVTSHVTDGEARSRVCQQCHDHTPATLRVWDGTLPVPVEKYTALAIDAAANYFGTLSGYGRGGHGDKKMASVSQGGLGLDLLNADLDSSHVPPIDCTTCHDQTAQHFPRDMGANLYRLRNQNVETGDSSDPPNNTGLCNQCHRRSVYPGTASLAHHPSYKKGTSVLSQDAIIPNASQEVMIDVNDATRWILIDAPAHYEQTAYGAGDTADGFSFPGNPDRLVDWYNRCPGGLATCPNWVPGSESHNQSPPPKPVFFGENGTSGPPPPNIPRPKAVLPLEKNLLNSGNSNRVLCVTCHNPHGTDGYVHDPLGGDENIADHNMLRLQDQDNTLCNACH